MLLTSVPQLHKKWEGGSLADAVATEVSGNGGPPERYSQSEVHPLKRRGARKLHRALAAEAARDAEREGRTDTYLRMHEEVPPLVEVEEDHFVAIAAGP
jgi:hypothetical protein